MNTKYLLGTPNSHRLLASVICRRYLSYTIFAYHGNIIQYALWWAVSHNLKGTNIFSLKTQSKLFGHLWGKKKKINLYFSRILSICTWGSVSNLLVSSISQGNINIKLRQIQSEWVLVYCSLLRIMIQQALEIQQDLCLLAICASVKLS